MHIHVTSLFVDDQEEAKTFYTRVLGFQVKHDVPWGEHRWLTVVSGQDPNGPELLLEPSAHPAVRPYRTALYDDGVPAHSFRVDDLDAERRRLGELGLRFPVEPMDAGPVRLAVLDNTCGNRIQLVQTMNA